MLDEFIDLVFVYLEHALVNVVGNAQSPIRDGNMYSVVLHTHAAGAPDVSAIAAIIKGAAARNPRRFMTTGSSTSTTAVDTDGDDDTEEEEEEEGRDEASR